MRGNGEYVNRATGPQETESIGTIAESDLRKL
jgi:hypothetical protein